MQTGDVFDDLAAEQDALEAVLSGLDQDAWCHASGAAGWTVADVVLHLAQTEEYVIASVTGNEAALLVRDRDGPPLDELMDRLVAGQRCAPPAAVFTRWQTARRAAVAALRACPSTVRLRWATIPLTPRTLATARLAEHWAHALDITVALGIATSTPCGCGTLRGWRIDRCRTPSQSPVSTPRRCGVNCSHRMVRCGSSGRPTRSR